MKTITIILALVLAGPAAAAPIYGDVTLDGGIRLWSIDTFLVAGFWTPDPDVTSTMETPFDIPAPTFDGKTFTTFLPFPARGCGTFQVDAWQHGGWWGEVRSTGLDCGETPVCLTCGPPPCLVDCDPPTPVPEPGTAGLFTLAGLVAAWKRWRRPARDRILVALAGGKGPGTGPAVSGADRPGRTRLGDRPMDRRPLPPAAGLPEFPFDHGGGKGIRIPGRGTGCTVRHEFCTGRKIVLDSA